MTYKPVTWPKSAQNVAKTAPTQYNTKSVHSDAKKAECANEWIFLPRCECNRVKKWTPCYLIEPEPHWKPVSNGRKKKCVMYFVYIYIYVYIYICVGIYIYIYIYIYNHYYTIKRMFTQFRTLRVKMHVTDFGPPPAPLWRDVITLRLCRLFTVESKHVFPQSSNQFCSTVVMFVMDIFYVEWQTNGKVS